MSSGDGGECQWHQAQKACTGLTVTDVAGWGRDGPRKRAWAEAAATHQARALEAWIGAGQEAGPFLMKLSFILTAWKVARMARVTREQGGGQYPREGMAPSRCGPTEAEGIHG